MVQETGKAYMQSMTGREIIPTTRGGFILAAIGYGSQRFAGSVPGSYKIPIPIGNSTANIKNNIKFLGLIRQNGLLGVDAEHHNANIRIFK